MDVDLSTHEDVTALLEAFARSDNKQLKKRRPHAVKRGERAVTDLEQARPVKSRPRCLCRMCRTCQENARWERIFNEKFADPSYYSDRVPSVGCPLASL
jgi:hypothetical protein